MVSKDRNKGKQMSAKKTEEPVEATLLPDTASPTPGPGVSSTTTLGIDDGGTETDPRGNEADPQGHEADTAVRDARRSLITSNDSPAVFIGHKIKEYAEKVGTTTNRFGKY